MPTIYVTDRDGNDHVLEVENGLTLMEPLRDLDDGVEALCGGMCSCATCHVFIDAEWLDKLPTRQDDEFELVESTECFRDDNSRLSCQITVSDALHGQRLTVAPEE